MPTNHNFELAFAEEAKNRQLFLAFAQKADAEGARQVARLFRAAAESELIHARAELEALGLVRSTMENVRHAVAVEENEFQNMYARFLHEAQRDGDGAAATLFGRILEVERGHHNLFREAFAALSTGADIPEAPILVCRTCGNTVVGQPPSICPVCGQPQEGFIAVA